MVIDEEDILKRVAIDTVAPGQKSSKDGKEATNTDNRFLIKTAHRHNHITKDNKRGNNNKEVYTLVVITMTCPIQRV